MKKRLNTFKLNRDTQQRSALLKSLLSALIQHESIVTTTPKAKAVMPIFDKFVTHAKNSTIASRRIVHTPFRAAAGIDPALVRDGLVARLGVLCA